MLILQSETEHEVSHCYKNAAASESPYLN